MRSSNQTVWSCDVPECEAHGYATDEDVPPGWTSVETKTGRQAGEAGDPVIYFYDLCPNCTDAARKLIGHEEA